MNAENVSQQTWDEDLYKFCTIEGFVIHGEPVSGDFLDCTFKGVDWYWGFFSGVAFVRCRFEACVFSGCNFTDVCFVACTFESCRFQKDNLGGDCDFTGAIASGCSLESCSGFTLLPAVESGFLQ